MPCGGGYYSEPTYRCLNCGQDGDGDGHVNKNLDSNCRYTYEPGEWIEDDFYQEDDDCGW